MTAARPTSSGKLLFSARIIPYRGSWLDFEFDPKDLRVFPRRPPPQDAGDDPAEVARAIRRSRSWQTFFEFDTFHFGKKGIQFELVPERLRGEIARFDIVDKAGKLIVAKDKRITVQAHPRDAGSRASTS